MTSRKHKKKKAARKMAVFQINQTIEQTFVELQRFKKEARAYLESSGLIEPGQSLQGGMSYMYDYVDDSMHHKIMMRHVHKRDAIRRHMKRI